MSYNTISKLASATLLQNVESNTKPCPALFPLRTDREHSNSNFSLLACNV